MITKKWSIPLRILFCTLLLPLNHVFSEIWLFSEGKSTVGKADAYQQAVNKAINQVISFYLHQDSIQGYNEILEQNIFDNPQSIIRDISEIKFSPDPLPSIVILCCVDEKRIQNILTDKNLIFDSMSKPSIMILSDNLRVETEEISREFIEHKLGLLFEDITKNTVSKDQVSPEIISRIIKGDIPLSVADIVIKISSNGRILPSWYKPVEINVSGKADIIMKDNSHRSCLGEGRGTANYGRVDKALDMALSEFVKMIKPKIIKIWNQETSKVVDNRICEIETDGLNLSQMYEYLSKAYEQGLTNIFVRSFGNSGEKIILECRNMNRKIADIKKTLRNIQGYSCEFLDDEEKQDVRKIRLKLRKIE